MPMSQVLVVFEICDGRLRASSKAAIGFAMRLVSLEGGSFNILAIGRDAAMVAKELTGHGAASVYVCDTVELSQTCAERFVPTIVAVAQRSGTTCIVATATSWGKDLMPRVAARLDAGYIGDCVGVTHQAGKLEYLKPTYAGNVIATYLVNTSMATLTVRESAWRAPQPTDLRPTRIATVEVETAGAAAGRVEVIGVAVVESKRPDLVEARRVVAGGRGLGAHFFDVLNPLADELGAAIGASRVACDFGHAPSDLQVGQTGKLIAPDLYVAVGISGAIQHTAGIRGAKVIVAVDNDPLAPIFSIADYGLVADAFEAIPLLVAGLRRHRRTET